MPTDPFTLVTTGLFLLSEALSLIPQVKSNGVFQLIFNTLSKLNLKGTAAVTLLIPAFLVVGACKHAAGDAAAVRQVMVKILADGKTAIVTGCKDLPAVESVASVVVPLVTGANAGAGALMAVAEKDADAVCAKVLASQTATP